MARNESKYTTVIREYHYEAYLAEFVLKKYCKFKERIDFFFYIMSEIESGYNAK